MKATLKLADGSNYAREGIVNFRDVRVNTQTGTSESRGNLGRIGLAIASGMRALDRAAFEDKETQDSLIRNSDLEWINVCPPRLTQGPRTGVYRFGVDLRPSPLSKISRADVADFMLNQLIDNTFVRKSPILFY